MEDYDSKNEISNIGIKTSNLNINKINKAKIINKSLYGNLKNDFLSGNINNNNIEDRQGLNEQFFNNINISLHNSYNYQNRNEPSSNSTN